MSSTAGQYRMDLIWASHGEQLRADLERTQGVLTGFDRRVQGHSRQLGLWGQQMRAIGTTIRYALAGGLIYGLATSVTKLSEFNDMLGQINATALRLTESRQFEGLGDQLDVLGDRAFALSNRWGVAADAVQEHMQRFFSSFDIPGTAQQQMEMSTAWAEQMVILQRALGREAGDPLQLSGGVAGLIQGMGPEAGRDPAATARRISNIIAAVLVGTPNITGVDIARDIGRLAGAQTSLRMTPEEIFAVYGTAARLGGAPAVIGRGITQLLTAELVNPQTEEQQRAFRQLGLPSDPGALREMGGWNVLMQLMSRFQAPTGAQQQILSTEEDPEAALRAAGIPKESVNLLFQAFGRMESARQFMNLLAVGGRPALEDFIKSIEDAKDSNRALASANARGQEDYLKITANSLSNFRTQLARGLEQPLLRPASWALRTAARLPDAVGPEGTAAIVGGGLAAGTLFRLLMRGRMTAALGRVPGLSRLMGRFGASTQQMALASVVGAGPGIFTATGTGAERAGSRGNPFWVVIDPLSWGMPGSPGGPQWQPGMAGESAAGGAARTGRGRFLPPVAVGLGSGAFSLAAILTQVPGATRRANAEDWERVGQGHPALRNLIRAYSRAIAENDPGLLNDVQRRALAAMGKPGSRGFDPGAAHRVLLAAERGRTPRGAFGAGSEVEGQVDATIRIEPTQGLERLVRPQEVKVPVKLWDVGGGRRPQSRGQNKTQRRGGR